MIRGTPTIVCFAISLSAALLAPLESNAATHRDLCDVSAFGVRADGSDATPGVRAALESLRDRGSVTLTFGPGRYDFWPDSAAERYLFVSNNDEGLKRIAFLLDDVTDLEIDGGGATFVFHGPMVPFLIKDSHRVTARGFSVDFDRPFHSEGRVIDASKDSVDVEFSGEFPWDVRNGVLVFTNGQKPAGASSSAGGGELLYPYGSLLEFDPTRRETAFMAKDRYRVGEGIAAERLSPHRARLRLPRMAATKGNILVFGAKHRDSPGFVISESEDVGLSDLTIHHCGGMGVIAQRSRNLSL